MGNFTKNVITNRTAILQICQKVDHNYAHKSSVSLQNIELLSHFDTAVEAT